MTNSTITLDELQAALDGPTGPLLLKAAWVQRMAQDKALGLPLPVVCEVAAEEDPRGPLATIHGLLDGLMLKHAGNDATSAALAAIAHLHLPRVLDDPGRVG